MRILVVDDSATMRRIFINSLQRAGLTDCVEADDGVTALAKFDASFDLVISDWNMPNMSGLDLVLGIRARPDGQRVRILIVTTRSSRDDVIAAVGAGANSYVVKPFTPEGLKKKIDSIMVGKGVAT